MLTSTTASEEYASDSCLLAAFTGYSFSNMRRSVQLQPCQLLPLKHGISLSGALKLCLSYKHHSN